MNLSNFQSYVIPEPFERALKSIRNALQELDVDVIGEFSMARVNDPINGRKPGCPKIFLVSSPILDFEAVALGREAAVFFPLHVLICPDGDTARVSLANPTSLFDARLPAGAVSPINRLFARVGLALEHLVERSAASLSPHPK